MPILPWLLALSAWGAAPTKAPGAFDTGAGGGISRLALSKDLGVLTGVTGAGQVVLLDVGGWVLAVTGRNGVSKANCSATAALAVVMDAARPQDGHWVYVGCADGTIRTWSWIDDELAPVEGDGGDDVVLASVGTEVYGLFPDPTKADTLYALLKTATPPTGTGTTSTYPGAVQLTAVEGVLTRNTAYTSTFVQNGFEQAFPVGAGAEVVVWHGGSQFSAWALATGVVRGTLSGGASGFTPYDVAPAQLTGAYFVEEPGTNKGRLGLWNGQSGQALQTLQVVDATFGGAASLVRTYREATSWWVFSRDERIVTYATTQQTLSDPETSFAVGFSAADLIEGPAGYVLAATDEGELVALTANPWVDAVSIAPASAVGGETVEVDFDVDAAVTWKVRVGGSVSSGGVKVAEGTTAGPDAVLTSFTVPAGLDEGGFPVWVDVTSRDGLGLVGHGRARLKIDSAPDTVGLTASGVGFGNRSIYLDFPAETAADVTGYRVYLSKTPFTAAAYPTGGPEGEVDGVTSPVFVEQPDTSTVSVRVGGLKNGTTYWVAVRATDGTNEGGMSDVFPVTPQATMTACDIKALEGEPCEAQRVCATSPVGLVGWAATLLAVGAARRRRRGAAVLSAAFVVGALALPEARAEEPTDADEAAEAEAEREAERAARLQRRRNRPSTGIFAHDTTPAWANFEFRGGMFSLRDDAIEAIYGQSAPLLNLEAGLQLFRYAEIDLGIGYLWKKGNTLSAGDGSSSREEARLQWLPLNIGGTLRAHVLDEQPLVPYASLGFTTVFWREQPLDADGLAVKTRRVNGSDYGWYWAVGGNLLLDLLNPRRASILEANSGINDTWLTVEYRQQIINPGGTGGFDLSGWAIQAGLKLDY